MPVNTHLEFQEISDFTPGYFSVGEWLMPGNGSQEMTDCRPDPGTGIRAAMKPTSFSVSGIPSTAYCIGIYSRGGIALQAAVGEGTDRYIAVYDTADNKVKIYRWNSATTTVATSWSLIKEHAAPASNPTYPNPVLFDTFVGSSGETYVVWTLAHTSADDGLWYLRFSYQAGQGASAIDDLGVTATRSVTQAIAGFATGVAVQDDVLIVALGAKASTLRWSASQDLTSWPAPNSLTVQASRQGSVITTITPFAPGDLLIGTRFSAWTMLQGGIADPIIRTMSDARTTGTIQRAAFTTKGIAAVYPKEGIFITSAGDTFQDLATQIDPNLWNQGATNLDVGFGNLSYASNFLLAPHGLFWDERVGSWFRSSVLITAEDHWHSWADPNFRTITAATGGDGFALWVYDTDEGDRWDTFTWKSAPMRLPQRNIRIREVQIVCKSYHADSTLAVTVNGVTRTATPGATGRQTVTVLFDAYAEMLDVQVVSASNETGYEAPSIEAVRVGSIVQHQTI